MKRIVFLGLILLMCHLLSAQVTCNEEVFPLMQNEKPSYICCEGCDLSVDTLLYITFHTVKDTLMLTNDALLLRFYSTHEQRRRTTIQLCHLKDSLFYLGKYKKFKLTKKITRNKYISPFEYTFYLHYNGSKIDFSNNFIAYNQTDTTFIWRNELTDSIRTHYNIVPHAHLLHTKLSQEGKKDYWILWFCDNYYTIHNLSITYNPYIEDSVYFLRFENIDGDYGITHMYLSYKYGILGIIFKQQDYYLKVQTIETWFPPFHSPAFRKEENPIIKE